MAYKRVKKDKKPYVLTIIGLILLILISSQTEGLAQTGSNLANTIFSPFEKVTYSISSAIIEQMERTIGSKETREQVLKLEADNRALVMENARLIAAINREDFLKEEAEATKGSENKYIKAKGYKCTKIENADLEKIDDEYIFRSKKGFYLNNTDDKFVITNSNGEEVFNLNKHLDDDTYNLVKDVLKSVGIIYKEKNN